MISRVAEACFWITRQIERADAMARILRVNRGFVLDASLPELRKWYPLLVVSGMHERFPEEARADGIKVQEFLVWDRANPVGVLSSVYWARQNALAIRDVISLEVWTVINELWHWLRGGQGRRLYRRDPDGFYRRICDSAAMVYGICVSTMLHEHPLDFMQLGMALERAGQTARVLDVHYHTFGSTETDAAPIAHLQWLALLRSCSGTEPFLKRVRTAPTATAVAGFLILDRRFPRSVLYCLDRARDLLGRVRPNADFSPRSEPALSALCTHVETLQPRTLVGPRLHAELTRVVDETAAVCDAIHRDYFAPGPDAADLT